jgi:hypothetical protein
MLRYWLLVFSLQSRLENKLVVSLSCRLGIARETKVSIKKSSMNYCCKLRNIHSNRVWNAIGVLIVTMDTTM